MEDEWAVELGWAVDEFEIAIGDAALGEQGDAIDEVEGFSEAMVAAGDEVHGGASEGYENKGGWKHPAGELAIFIRWLAGSG